MISQSINTKHMIVVLRILAEDLEWISIFKLKDKEVCLEQNLRNTLSYLYDRKLVTRVVHRRAMFYAITQNGLDYLIANSSRSP